MRLNKFNKSAETVDTYTYSPPTRSMFSPKEKDIKERGLNVSLPEKPKVIDQRPITQVKGGVSKPQ